MATRFKRDFLLKFARVDTPLAHRFMGAEVVVLRVAADGGVVRDSLFVSQGKR